MGNYDVILKHVHQNSTLLILEQIQPESTILKFGPANECMTSDLKERLHCEVYDVETEGNMEPYGWFQRYGNTGFDYIIFLDVLSYLSNPVEVLNKSKHLLKAEGSILITVSGFASYVPDVCQPNHHRRNEGLWKQVDSRLEKILEEAKLHSVKKIAAYADPEQINTIPSLQGFAQHQERINQFVYEVKKDSDECLHMEDYSSKQQSQSCMQLYVFHNQMFDKSRSKRAQIVQIPGIQTFSFNCPEDVRILRLDPMEGGGVVRLLEVFAKGPSGEVLPEVKVHNAQYVWGNIYFFETNTPQWIFFTSDSIQSIHLKVEFIFMGDIRPFSPIIKELLRQLRACKQQVITIQQDQSPCCIKEIKD